MKITLTGILNDATLASFKEALGEAYEKATSIEFESGEQRLIPKNKFDEQAETIKLLNTQIKERDGKLEELSKLQDLTTEQKSKINELTEASKKLSEDFKAQMTTYKSNVAWDKALSSSGAKNANALKGMMDLSKITYDEEGDKLIGYEEQLAQIRKDNEWLFDTKIPSSAGREGSEPKGGMDEFADFRNL